MHIAFILTKPPYGGEESERVLEMAQDFLLNSHQLTLFLIGDGVLGCKANQKGGIGQSISNLIHSGARVFVAEHDLEARGLPSERRLEGITVTTGIFDQLVDTVMEEADRVISC